ncbi:MAG: 30S ribosomal protein S8 [Flavobacteriales endosymbiont of Rhyzopertha dominica]|nr:MAG: 30S ribosomal protein S8 [Candidatus Shikimatogenerans bostrichidophilus]
MDIIGNYITLIRNGCYAKKNKIYVKYSKLILNITKILYKYNYLNKYKIINNESNKNKKLYKLLLYLKYINEYSVIRNIKRISKPSLRKYYKYKNIFKVLNGYGKCIISTSKGIMTGEKAIKNKIGGEILFIIY